MYYELYVDSLFLVNFVMNLYLLMLVNQSTFRTATRLRLILGAAAGAIIYLIPFICSGPILLKSGVCLLAGTIGMLFIAFRVKSIKAFLQLVRKLLLWSLLMGGTLLFLINRLPVFRRSMTGIAGLLGMGTMAFLLFSYLRRHRQEKACVCRVTLLHRKESVTVSALLDSGNGLVEPVSGKPVSIIEKQVFNVLWKEPPAYYRAIPYHSIGKTRGILQGYLLPELQIEVNGVIKVCRDVYVAVCDEQIMGRGNSARGVRMILNPVLLEE